MANKTYIVTFFSWGNAVKQEELDILYVFYESALKAYRTTNIIILSDPESAARLSALGYSVYNRTVDRSTLLLDRTRGYAEVLESLPEGAEVLFLDYDIILNAPLAWSGDSFDVGYTIRVPSKFPINGGVIWIPSLSPKITHYFRTLSKKFEALPKKDQKWWGDQIAVWSIFSAHTKEIMETGFHTSLGVKFAFLETQRYNWTPFDMGLNEERVLENLYLPAHQLALYDSAFVNHFKGIRKHLMIHCYARRNGLPVIFDLSPRVGPDDFEQFCFETLKYVVALLNENAIQPISSDYCKSIWYIHDTVINLFILSTKIANSSFFETDTCALLEKVAVSLFRESMDARGRVLLGDKLVVTQMI